MHVQTERFVSMHVMRERFWSIDAKSEIFWSMNVRGERFCCVNCISALVFPSYGFDSFAVHTNAI